MFKKFICKKKGHNFINTHKESDGWGNTWHCKKCKRCGYAMFDSEPVDPFEELEHGQGICYRRKGEGIRKE